MLTLSWSRTVSSKPPCIPLFVHNLMRFVSFDHVSLFNLDMMLLQMQYQNLATPTSGQSVKHFLPFLSAPETKQTLSLSSASTRESTPWKEETPHTAQSTREVAV
jgi:hypothetical protein